MLGPHIPPIKIYIHVSAILDKELTSIFCPFSAFSAKRSIHCLIAHMCIFFYTTLGYRILTIIFLSSIQKLEFASAIAKQSGFTKLKTISKMIYTQNNNAKKYKKNQTILHTSIKSCRFCF